MTALLLEQPLSFLFEESQHLGAYFSVVNKTVFNSGVVLQQIWLVLLCARLLLVPSLDKAKSL